MAVPFVAMDFTRSAGMTAQVLGITKTKETGIVRSRIVRPSESLTMKSGGRK